MTIPLRASILDFYNAAAHQQAELLRAAQIINAGDLMVTMPEKATKEERVELLNLAAGAAVDAANALIGDKNLLTIYRQAMVAANNNSRIADKLEAAWNAHNRLLGECLTDVSGEVMEWYGPPFGALLECANQLAAVGPQYSRARTPKAWRSILKKLEHLPEAMPSSTFRNRITEGKPGFRYHRSPDSTSKAVKLLLADLGPAYDDSEI